MRLDPAATRKKKTKMSQDRLSRLREYRDLEARTAKPGLTPLEYLRWCELRGEVGSAAGEGAHQAVCLIAEWDTYAALGESWITALSGGGVFVSTPFAPPVSTEFVLAVIVKESGERFEVPGVVASHNLDAGFSTRSLGMGVRFRPRTDQHHAHLSAMRSAAGVGNS